MCAQNFKYDIDKILYFNIGNCAQIFENEIQKFPHFIHMMICT